MTSGRSTKNAKGAGLRSNRLWLSRMRGLLDYMEMQRAFRSRWKASSLTNALEVLRTMDEFLQAADIPYLSCGSTLLGIERHQGVIPWCDVLQFCIAERDLNRLMSLRESFAAHGIELGETEFGFDLLWKVGRGSTNARRIKFYLWRERQSDVTLRGRLTRYRLVDFLPSRRARFHDLLLPVPQNSRSILSQRFGPHFMTQVFCGVAEQGAEIEPKRMAASPYPLPPLKTVFSARRMPQRQLCEMLLRAGVEFLRASGVEFWADYGTLLGIHRGGKLLAHDQDVDFSLMEESMPQLLRSEHLLDSDYQLVDRSYRHHGPRYEIVHRKFKGHCDFYSYRKLGNGELRVCFGDAWHGTMDARDIPESMVFPLHSAKIGAISVLCPSMTDEYLKHRYGYLGSPAILKGDGSGHYRPLDDRASGERRDSRLSSTNKSRTDFALFP